MANTPKENALSLYREGILEGRAREAVEKYTGDRYTQHSTGVADGVEGFVEFFEPFLERNPVRDFQFVRALQDGPNVFLQAYQNINNGEAYWITTDFFDTDHEGKIVEHWDVIAAPAPANAAGRTQIDGPTKIEDLDATDANRATVKAFIKTCLIDRQVDLMEQFIDSHQFYQHTAYIGDGLEAFANWFGAEECPLTYQECFMAVAEGNFVATLNRAQWDGSDICHVDLYRLSKGRIVEHWDNSEPVPPKDEWANSGKF